MPAALSLTMEKSIGQQLCDARETRGLSVSQAAAATRIKFQHIEDMESDNFSNIAAAAYARGFIKIYADLLGIDSDPLVQLYQEKHAQPPLRRPSDDLIEGEQPSTHSTNLSSVSEGERYLSGEGTRLGRWLVLFVILGMVAAILAWWWNRSRTPPTSAINVPLRNIEPLRLGGPLDAYLPLPEKDMP